MEKLLKQIEKQYRKEIRGKSDEWLFIKLEVKENITIEIKQYGNWCQILRHKESGVRGGGTYHSTQKAVVNEVMNFVKYCLENY